MLFKIQTWHTNFVYDMLNLQYRIFVQNEVYIFQILSSVTLPVNKKVCQEWFIIAMYCSDSGYVSVSVKVSSLFVVVSSPTS